MWAITVKELRQLRRDHRMLALIVVMPLVMLVVFGYAASFDVTEVRTVVAGPQAAVVAAQAPSVFRVEAVRPADGRAEAAEALRDGEAVVALVTRGAPPGAPPGGPPPFSPPAPPAGPAPPRGAAPGGF